MLRSVSNYPLTSLESFNCTKVEPSAFTGGTANTRGNESGTSDPFTLFTVTGDVLVRVFGVCTVDLAGAGATVEVGTAKSTAGLITQSTATDIDAGELWHDATPDLDIELATIASARFIINGANIIESVGTANVTAGNIYYICLWRPISGGSKVVPAV